MDGPVYHSSSWTGPAEPQTMWADARLRRTAFRDSRPLEQRLATANSSLLMIVPLLCLPSSVWLVKAGSADALSSGPNPTAYAYAAALAGLILWLLARSFLPLARIIIPLAGLGWIGSFLGATYFVALATSDHHFARLDSARRAHIVGFQRTGRQISAAIVELQGGERLKADSFPWSADGTRCYLVQKLEGPHGFVWLRWLDASPAPGPGKLAWSLDTRKCFSGTPLSEIHA